MNIVNVIDKVKAEELHSKGFAYKEQNLGSKKIYSFIGTPELINLLNANFSKQDFFMSKHMNF